MFEVFPIFVIINDIFTNTLGTKMSSAFQSLSVDWQSPTSGSSRFMGTTCLRFLLLKIVFGKCGTGLYRERQAHPQPRQVHQ